MSLLSFLKGESPGPFERIPHMLQGKGHYGEYLAEYAVGNNNLPGQSVTYMNILVPRRGKATSESEIDVLVLHERGIYVIESKNYIGWIFGNKNQRQWTMCLRHGRKEHFYNPIKQNQTHVRALAEGLRLPESAFRSFIVFSDKCELKNVPLYGEFYRVCQRRHLVHDMKCDLERRQVVFNEDEFAALKVKLDELKAASSDEALAKHTEEARAVVAGKICPYCGADLVERRRKADGKTFIGCSAFPKCKYTRNGW